MPNEHYAQFKPQTIERMHDVMTEEEFQGFCRGNIIKYAERLRSKGKPLENAIKILDYAYWLVNSLQGKALTLPVPNPGYEDEED